MTDQNLLVAMLTACAGVIGTYITVRLKKPKPKSEYIDTAMEAYESIIKRCDTENERLRLEIEVLQNKLDTAIAERVKAQRELEELRSKYDLMSINKLEKEN